MTINELINILENNFTEEEKNKHIIIGEENIKKKRELKNKYQISGISKTCLFNNALILFNKETKFEGAIPPDEEENQNE